MCAHLIIHLCELNEDRERQAEEQVTNHRPATAKLLVYTDRRYESLPRLFINIHYQTQAEDYRKALKAATERTFWAQ